MTIGKIKKRSKKGGTSNVLQLLHGNPALLGRNTLDLNNTW